MAIGVQRVTTCLLQRGPHRGDTATPDLLGRLVELPLRRIRLEQLQLSFHVPQYPQGV